ncbi:hypothetical protein H632_c1320p1, partial [Helicosporidium sp. ATCC 50920]
MASKFEQAAQYFGEALEESRAEHGDLGAACAEIYYRLGSSLLYNYQENSTLLDTRGLPGTGQGEDEASPEAEPQDPPSAVSAVQTGGEGSDGAAVAAASAAPPSAEGTAEGDDADSDEGEGESEEDGGAQAEAEEEEAGDLQLAWENLEAARLIWTRPDAEVPGARLA